MSRLTINSVEPIDNRLIVRFSCTGSLKKFFNQNMFFAEYNTSIEGVPEAILVIPFLGTVCPVAWANKADVYVDTVDESFLHALPKVKRTLHQFYPKMRFQGKIHAKNIIKPDVTNHSKSMMLFSGGLDSLTTYVRHQTEKPILASVHGADVPSDNREAWNTLVKSLTAFSNKTESKLMLIRSNFRYVIHSPMLDECYDRCIPGSWYYSIGHGLALLSLCAPIAFKEKVGKLYISSTYHKDDLEPLGSHPNIDNNVEWTGTKVVHDGLELTRQGKIGVIADYIKTKGDNLYIRSCYRPDKGDNCSRCEKCIRTAVGLMLEGIDPNECGYVVKSAWIKQNLMYGTLLTKAVLKLWEDIRSNIRLEQVFHNKEAKELIIWLKNAKLHAVVQNKKEDKKIRKKLFIKFTKHLPDPLYIIIKKILLKVCPPQYFYTPTGIR